MREREREREREFSVRQLPTGFCESYSKGYLILKGNLCQQVCVEPPPSALSVMLLFAAECRRLRHTCSYWLVCSYWSISPACSCSAANAPADVTAVNRTDRRMHDSYIDSAPHTMRAASIIGTRFTGHMVPNQLHWSTEGNKKSITNAIKLV